MSVTLVMTGRASSLQGRSRRPRRPRRHSSPRGCRTLSIAAPRLPLLRHRSCPVASLAPLAAVTPALAIAASTMPATPAIAGAAGAVTAAAIATAFAPRAAAVAAPAFVASCPTA